MRLDTTDRTVESSGFVEEKPFTIAANGKAFRILIDKMYSAIHVAIVRELMTNAWDAHVLAGNLKPFEIHVPTTFEPFFSIRDFGCAMTHDQVMNVYSTIFESTKDARDDQVGAWGLGSKTPFAYTDTFSVQVWKDGRHRVYSVFIDARGVPKIALALDEENDGAAEGVEIKFPVAPKDAGQFRQALEIVSIGFDIKPILSSKLAIPEFELLRKGKGWSTFAYKTGSAWLRTPLARVGCVLYPIDFTALRSYVDSNKVNLPWYALISNDKGFKSSAMLIDFPIGAVEVTANREGLYYSDKTNKAIIARFQDMIDEMQDDFEYGIIAATTLHEANMTALQVCRAFDDVSPIAAHYLREYAETLKFKARHLLTSVNLTHKSVTKESKNEKGETVLEHYPTNFCSIDFMHHHGDKFVKKPGLKFFSEEYIKWTPTPVTVYVELISAKNTWVPFGSRRVRHDREKLGVHKSQDLIWIRTPSLKDYGFLKMMAALGKPIYKLVNDLEKPASMQFERSETPMRYYDSKERDWVVFEDFDPENDAGYYVTLLRGKPVDFNRHEFMTMINELVGRKLMEHPGKIIGVPASRKSVLNKGDGWISLQPAICEAYQKALDINEAMIQFSIQQVDITVDNRLDQLEVGFKHARRKLPDNCLIYKAFNARKRFQQIEAKAKSFNSLWQSNYILPRDKREALSTEYATIAKTADPALIQELTELKGSIEGVFVKYPLLTQFHHPSNNMMPQIADYIEGLDILEKVRQDATVQGKDPNP